MASSGLEFNRELLITSRTHPLNIHLQGSRPYTTIPPGQSAPNPKNKRADNTLIYTTLGLAAAAGAYYYFRNTDEAQELKDGAKTGQAQVKSKLDQSKVILFLVYINNSNIRFRQVSRKHWTRHSRQQRKQRHGRERSLLISRNLQKSELIIYIMKLSRRLQVRKSRQRMVGLGGASRRRRKRMYKFGNN